MSACIRAETTAGLAQSPLKPGWNLTGCLGAEPTEILEPTPELACGIWRSRQAGCRKPRGEEVSESLSLRPRIEAETFPGLVELEGRLETTVYPEWFQ